MNAQTRINQVRTLLEQEQLDGVILLLQSNLSWLFKGRFHINVASEEGVASVFVTRTSVAGLVNNIEYERLVAEEGLDCDTWHVVPWHDEPARQAILDGWGNSGRVKTDAQLAQAFLGLRVLMTQVEQGQLRLLGPIAAHAVEAACKACQPDETEQAVGARVAAACASAGVDPVVLLVAGARRAPLYRHGLPTDQAIGQSAIVSVCGRKYGLIVSVTRMVHFGSMPDDLAHRHEAVRSVDATMIDASRPGQALADVFAQAVAAYAEVGYPQEWTFHHQGGLAGYRSREMRATPTATLPLQAGHIVAWNPSIAGVKSEDTVLIHPDAHEVLTDTGGFPQVPVKVNGHVVVRPSVLIR